MPSKTVQFAPGNTNWNLVGFNGAAYATAALLNAAKDTPFPRGPDLGLYPASDGQTSNFPMLTMKSINAGADGNLYYFNRDLPVPPTSLTGGFPVDGSNQGFTINASGLYCIWLRLTASGDVVTLYYVQP